MRGREDKCREEDEYKEERINAGKRREMRINAGKRRERTGIVKGIKVQKKG